MYVYCTGALCSLNYNLRLNGGLFMVDTISVDLRLLPD